MNMDYGETYFKTYRKLFGNELWNNVLEFRLFFWIVGHAVFDPEGLKIGNVKICRGQYLRSYSKLIEDLAFIDNRRILHYSKSQIHRAIKKLILLQNITVSETELGTLFTVVNYDKYQPLKEENKGIERFTRKQKDEPGTGLGTNLERLENNNNKVIRKKNNNIYSIRNIPPNLNGELFLKNEFFFITNKLKDELKNNLSLRINDDEMKYQFLLMTTWMEENGPQKNYKIFFMNWFKRLSEKSENSKVDQGVLVL